MSNVSGTNPTSPSPPPPPAEAPKCRRRSPVRLTPRSSMISCAPQGGSWWRSCVTFFFASFWHKLLIFLCLRTATPQENPPPEEDEEIPDKVEEPSEDPVLPPEEASSPLLTPAEPTVEEEELPPPTQPTKPLFEISERAEYTPMLNGLPVEIESYLLAFSTGKDMSDLQDQFTNCFRTYRFQGIPTFTCWQFHKGAEESDSFDASSTAHLPFNFHGRCDAIAFTIYAEGIEADSTAMPSHGSTTSTGEVVPQFSVRIADDFQSVTFLFQAPPAPFQEEEY